MKVLFVQKEGGIFGAENYQLKIIPGLLNEGLEVDFLRLYTNYQGGVGGDFVARLNNFGVKVHQVNIGKYPTPNVLKKVHNIAKNGGYDLIHTHLIHADLYLTLAKKLFRGKYKIVSTKHGYDNSFTSKFGFDASKQTNTAYYLISKWAEKRMNASFTISNGLRNFFIETGLADSDKMSLIYYGFDMPENYNYKSDKNYRLAKKQILIAGRLIPFKGHRFLIESLTNIVGKLGGDVKLVILGSGDQESNLKRMVSSLGLDVNVEFLGYSKEVGRFMANSDVVVVPSVSEGFGVVFLEAFSAKTPVVAWDVSAANELIRNNKTGFLVEPYNTEALAYTILTVLNNENNTSKVVDEAYKELTSYFCLTRMMEETISFYNRNIS